MIKPVRDPTVSVRLSSAKRSLKEVWFYGKFSSRLLVPYLPLPGQLIPVPEVTDHECLSDPRVPLFLCPTVEWTGILNFAA